MKRKSIGSAVLCSFLSFGAFGCGEGEGNGEPTGTTGPVLPPAPPGQCLTQTGADGNLLLMANEANNYTLANQLLVQSTAIGPGTQLTLDWSALTVDMFKHNIVPGEIDRISLAQWELTHQDVMDALASDELGSSGALVLGIEHIVTGAETSIPITQMQLPYGGGQPPAEQVGMFLDPATWPPDRFSYTMTVNTGDYLKSGARMVHHAYLDPASTNHVIAITNTSTEVQIMVELDAIPPVLVPALSNAITVDWSQMMTNSLGRPFQKQTIAEVRVMHFPFTPLELEQKFLDLELIADATYVGMVQSGESLALTSLTDGAGQPFVGIDPGRGGTWVVALLCLEGLCGNPAPWFMARLEACPQAL